MLTYGLRKLWLHFTFTHKTDKIIEMKKESFLLLIADIILINVAIILSFWIRLPNFLETPNFQAYQQIAFFFVALKLISYWLFGLYGGIWRYSGINEAFSVFKAVSVASLATTGLVFFTQALPFPRSVILLDWFFNLFLIGGLRFTPRLRRELGKRRIPPDKRLLIIGAGDAGEMVLREINKHPELGYKIIGFIDDDLKKVGRKIHNLKVLGTRKEITGIISQKNIDELIIAIPSASGKVTREIIREGEKARVKLRILPGIYKVIKGDVTISEIREVKLEDLLGRKPVEINIGEVSQYLEGKSVLITGAAGSIGSELAHQIMRFKLGKLLLLDNNENETYFLQMELMKKKPLFPIIFLINDIKERDVLETIWKNHQPEVVFHTAAHKHVPLMEENVAEAVRNNILGTKNLMEVANGKSERFILISTDKAVNPKSIMGATKRVTELMMQFFNDGTKFCAVRFGNVLGSKGSVVPLFKKQITEGGPVTVTHPEIKRYFMSISESVSLIIQAGAISNGGEVFVLDMGEPIKIINLAKDLITLSGLEPEIDIPIKITSIRPGEKLNEELLTAAEGIKSTKKEKIFLAKPDTIDPKKLLKDINDLEKFTLAGEKEKIVKKFREMGILE